MGFSLTFLVGYDYGSLGSIFALDVSAFMCYIILGGNMDNKDKQKNQIYSTVNKYYHGTKAQESQTKPKKKKASAKKALITATCLTLAGTGLFFGGRAVYKKIKESQTPPDTPITGKAIGRFACKEDANNPK